MSNSEKLLKLISSLVENGVLSSKDIKNEISTNLKFKKDFLIEKFNLVSREEFEILKKLVQKQEKEINSLKKKKTKKVKKS
jgi:BMFP domain-containing protein YqiC|tara:strand:- start:189 stop:431 length:243 start_codon:yes stop_codon:yes gene_type:complete